MLLVPMVFIFLLFSAFALAEEESLVIQARVTVFRGAVTVDDIQVVHGIPMENDATGRHIAQLLDRDISTLYQMRFYLEEVAPSMPETIPIDKRDEFIENETSFEALLFFPFFEEAEIIAIGAEDGNLMAFVGIKEILCNGDGECGEGENFLSCEEDCPLRESDNYCLPETDNICDPDCIEGLDEDCGPGQGNGADGGGTEGLSLTEYYFIGAVAFIVIAIVGYNLARRKRKGVGR